MRKFRRLMMIGTLMVILFGLSNVVQAYVTNYVDDSPYYHVVEVLEDDWTSMVYSYTEPHESSGWTFTTTTHTGTCAKCGHVLANAPHGNWKYTIIDSTSHRKACGVCGYETVEVHHDLNHDAICDECGYNMSEFPCTLVTSIDHYSVTATTTATPGSYTIARYEFYVNGVLKRTVNTSRTSVTVSGMDGLGFGENEIKVVVTTTDDHVAADSNIQETFYIYTEEDLRLFSNYVASGTTYSGKNIYLMADISMSSNPFVPVGGQTYAFEGTFKGNHHSITGLTISRGDYAYNGLFGKISSSATVRNVRVEGTVSGANYSAGIVGYNLGTIENCISEVNVANYSTYKQHGGIAGYNAGSISNCTNYRNRRWLYIRWWYCRMEYGNHYQMCQ